MTLDVISSVRRRRRRAALITVTAAAMLAATVYAAGVYATSRLGDGERPPLPTPTSSGAGLPADIAWIRVAGVDLPVSEATGPNDTIGGLARGFAHTPAGAVVAALHLIVRVTPQVGPAVFEPTLATQVVGKHADALRREVAQAYEDGARAAGVVNAGPLGELPARVAGARVDSYTDASAVVSVLTSVVDPEGTTLYAATAVSLSWMDGDWRLVAPDAGRWDEVVRPVDPRDATTFPTIGRR